jgi:predicted Fe-Mo cluster-binding NifX family protein
MKIAVITDDFKTISAHFGRAQHYQVFTVENGQIVGQESRSKANHSQFIEQELHNHQPGEGHGSDPASQHRHATMMDPISDCQVLLARGMGMGAHDALRSRRIQPILTDIQEIEPAVKAYIDGQLVDHPERLH